MSFTDQKPRIATAKDIALPWNGRKDVNFRCYLCGHRFVIGDPWRWVFGRNKVLNFIVCGPCDGPDVLDRFIVISKEARERFWWLRR